MGRVSSTAASTLGSGVSSPSIDNVTVVGGVETTIALPAGTRRFAIKHRKSSKFEVRYVSASTEFFTNKGGNIYVEDGLAPTTTYTVYITPLNSGVLEIKSWA